MLRVLPFSSVLPCVKVPDQTDVVPLHHDFRTNANHVNSVYSISPSKLSRRILHTTSVQAEERIYVTAESPEDSYAAVGDVEGILGSRVVDRSTEYLVEWKDDHPDTWEPASNIASDLVAGFEEPWWAAGKKADVEKLKELLETGRDPNAIDENERSALHFASGMGSEDAIKVLTEAGAAVEWQDKDGYTPLHLAAGYIHTPVVALLLSLGANPEREDNQGRSSLQLAQQLLLKIPKNNPTQFGRRMALDQVVKLLDEAVFEEVEVEAIVDKRTVDGVGEYLVRWSDSSEDSWEPAENIGEDLVKDYEEGLEYVIAEKVIQMRETEGGKEYLVCWEDGGESWEPEKNVALEVIAEFEKGRVGEVEVLREE